MKTQSENDLICIQQALEDLATMQGYQSTAVAALDRLRGERDRYEAALEDIRDQSQDRADEAAGIARRALNP